MILLTEFAKIDLSSGGVSLLVEEFIELAKKICVQKSEEQTVELKAAHIDCPKRLYDTYPAFPTKTAAAY